jgi:hypothetical protein
VLIVSRDAALKSTRYKIPRPQHRQPMFQPRRLTALIHALIVVSAAERTLGFQAASYSGSGSSSTDDGSGASSGSGAAPISMSSGSSSSDGSGRGSDSASSGGANQSGSRDCTATMYDTENEAKACAASWGREPTTAHKIGDMWLPGVCGGLNSPVHPLSPISPCFNVATDEHEQVRTLLHHLHRLLSAHHYFYPSQSISLS